MLFFRFLCFVYLFAIVVFWIFFCFIYLFILFLSILRFLVVFLHSFSFRIGALIAPIFDKNTGIVKLTYYLLYNYQQIFIFMGGGKECGKSKVGCTMFNKLVFQLKCFSWIFICCFMQHSLILISKMSIQNF